LSVSKAQRFIIDSLILGVVGALSAQLFMFLLHAMEQLFLVHIAAYLPPGLPDEGGVLLQWVGPHGLTLIPLATVLGALVSGVLIYTFAPEAEGHGTDTAVTAFHRAAGVIRGRVPILKTIGSAITIGSGGAAGREGPTALISAGIGSVYAGWTHRSDEDRRLLTLVGMAAGLSAIFRSPVGSALFAIEVLYGHMEFESGALLYTMLASIVAYTINGIFVGWKPLFQVTITGVVADDILWYALLGLLSGVVATILPMAFYGVRDLFRAIRIPPHFKPAIGGLGLGILALELPQVLGGGYGWIQEAMDGKLAVTLLLALMVGKLIAFCLTVSSGGSGGVFAPSLFVGAMLGGAMAETLHVSPAAFVVVAMAAVFGGAARVPIATLFMVTEMTGGYKLLVPAALAVTLSYMVQVALSSRLKYGSLYEGQVDTRVESPAHHLEHLRGAFRLLREGHISSVNDLDNLDLQKLIASGVTLEFPNHWRLCTCAVRRGGPLEGQSATKEPLEVSGCHPLLVVRDGRTLLPDSGVRLEAGDELFLAAPEGGCQRLREALSEGKP
jgi:CIC family chloride channel protein